MAQSSFLIPAPSSNGPAFILSTQANEPSVLSDEVDSLAAETTSETGADGEYEDGARAGPVRRAPMRVIPELPRTTTLKRQQSEKRNNLAPIKPSLAERRAVSADRRLHISVSPRPGSHQLMLRSSAPSMSEAYYTHGLRGLSIPTPMEPTAFPEWPDSIEDEDLGESLENGSDYQSRTNAPLDTQSVTSSQWARAITEELEKKWILNLSMHFRDKSKREKFFVTYREHDEVWRRVTVSLDYREAPENSLEEDLSTTKYQRDKSTKIYEAIRDSLADIKFYDTATNLKLQTTEGRLHVHVMEDTNEIIKYPQTRQIRHLRCKRVRERDVEFVAHMSGFVYQVRVDGRTLIKKEIPGPDTIDEFLYEVNALSRLEFSDHVIQFHGVIVDDEDQYIRGLLISYAENGALIDIIFEHGQEHMMDIPWPTREKWARQIIHGLADVHETGFVQGDFTLSNIVIDKNNDAKIIDINRRGCPVGWEPPEATPLTESNQRIFMYIGIKSDLYQLGMVLWALAMQEDEPESLRRPLQFPPGANVPQWYRFVVASCLSEEPRQRLHASHLLRLMPGISATDVAVRPPYGLERNWSCSSPNGRNIFVDATQIPFDNIAFARGRSPPSSRGSDYEQQASLRTVSGGEHQHLPNLRGNTGKQEGAVVTTGTTQESPVYGGEVEHEVYENTTASPSATAGNSSLRGRGIAGPVIPLNQIGKPRSTEHDDDDDDDDDDDYDAELMLMGATNGHAAEQYTGLRDLRNGCWLDVQRFPDLDEASLDTTDNPIAANEKGLGTIPECHSQMIGLNLTRAASIPQDTVFERTPCAPPHVASDEEASDYRSMWEDTPQTIYKESLASEDNVWTRPLSDDEGTQTRDRSESRPQTTRIYSGNQATRSPTGPHTFTSRPQNGGRNDHEAQPCRDEQSSIVLFGMGTLHDTTPYSSEATLHDRLLIESDDDEDATFNATTAAKWATTGHGLI